MSVISFYQNAGKSRETAPHAHGSMRNMGLLSAEKGGSRLLGGGGGDPPTPHPSIGQTGGYPLPLRPRPGPAITLPKNHQNPPFTLVVPCEIPVIAMQKKELHDSWGGRGVIPLPPHLLFFRRGSPPTHMPSKLGGTPYPSSPGRTP